MITKNNTIALATALGMLFSSFVITSFKEALKRDNVLTKAEKKAGWLLLFDGKTTRGWRTYQNKPQDSWEIVSGELHCKKDGVTKRADLVTSEEYENFELTFDWKVSPGANSGVMYRVNENNPAAYESGPEYQLIDDNGYTEKLEDWQKSGADYAMHPPTTIASKPVGQYNNSRIVVNNSHVEQYLNGIKVADFNMWTPEWEQLKSESKWKDAKDYGMVKSGYIALQDHGGGISFKNIKLRRL